MISIGSRALDRAVRDLPATYAGPGGAVAVVKDGEAILRHAWGLADRERRIPFTPRSLMPMCSITKQFTCALVLAAWEGSGRWMRISPPACPFWRGHVPRPCTLL
jgi:D-aminopeptidase